MRVAWVIALACFTQFVAASQADRDKFLSLSETWLIRESVVVTQQARGEWAGLIRFGFDPNSGAWFLVTPSMVSGRDPQGRGYEVKEVGGSVASPVHSSLPFFVGSFLPAAILAAIHEDPGAMLGAELQGESWIVRYRVVADSSKNPPRTVDYVAEFDASSGRLKSREREHPTDRQRIEYDLSDPRIERRVYESGGATYAYTVDRAVPSVEFTIEKVVPQMMELKIAVDQRLAAISAGYSEDEHGEMEQPANASTTVSYANGKISKFRWPLLAGGFILVGVAAVELVRRRSA